MKRYGIRSDYVHRSIEEHGYYDDTQEEDGWQNEVYVVARSLAKEGDRILDIGTGSGFKLLKYFADFDTTGLDLNPTLKWLNNAYPDRKWDISDLSDLSVKYYDVVICSDVIEHIPDPDDLLAYLKSIRSRVVILSTPEREIVRGDHLGPPHNLAHFREWSIQELNDYLGQHFDIVSHFVSNPNPSVGTQLVVMKNRVSENYA